jgi:hypothetical protein
MPVAGAQPGIAGSFGREGVFRHFNKLTPCGFLPMKLLSPCREGEVPLPEPNWRMANPSYKRRARQPWWNADVSKLKQLAKGRHADRRHEHQAATPHRSHSQQGATRGNFAQACQPFALHQTNQSCEAVMIKCTAGVCGKSHVVCQDPRRSAGAKPFRCVRKTCTAIPSNDA